MPLWWGIPLVNFAGLPGRHFFSNRWNYEKVVGALFRFFRSVPGSWTCTTPFFPIKNLLFFHHDSLPKKGGPNTFMSRCTGILKLPTQTLPRLMTRKSVPKLPGQHWHQVGFPPKKEMGTSMTPSYKSPWKNNCHVMVFIPIHPSSSPL